MYRMMFLLIFPFTLSAQSLVQSDVQTIISEIDFSQDTVKGIYNWITANIKYDVKELDRIEEARRKRGRKTKKNHGEWKENILKSVIKKKKGVCQGYSMLFEAIATELGMPCVVIEGYTKSKDGNLNLKVGHAWNAIRTAEGWILCDATWGAGYVDERGKFVKAQKDTWYDVDPELMKTRHMPFDPIWQLLEHPSSYKAFKTGEDIDASMQFKMPDDVDAFYAMYFEERQLRALERSAFMEQANSLVKRWRSSNSKKIKMSSDNELSDNFNVLSQRMSTIVEELNTYYKKGRKKRFSSKVWTKDYAHQKLMSIRSDAEAILIDFESMKANDRRFNKMISDTKTQTRKLILTISDEVEFLEKL